MKNYIFWHLLSHDPRFSKEDYWENFFILNYTNLRYLQLLHTISMEIFPMGITTLNANFQKIMSPFYGSSNLKLG